MRATGHVWAVVVSLCGCTAKLHRDLEIRALRDGDLLAAPPAVEVVMHQAVGATLGDQQFAKSASQSEAPLLANYSVPMFGPCSSEVIGSGVARGKEVRGAHSTELLFDAKSTARAGRTASDVKRRCEGSRPVRAVSTAESSANIVLRGYPKGTDWVLISSTGDMDVAIQPADAIADVVDGVTIVVLRPNVPVHVSAAVHATSESSASGEQADDAKHGTLSISTLAQRFAESRLPLVWHEGPNVRVRLEVPMERLEQALSGSTFGTEGRFFPCDLATACSKLGRERFAVLERLEAQGNRLGIRVAFYVFPWLFGGLPAGSALLNGLLAGRGLSLELTDVRFADADVALTIGRDYSEAFVQGLRTGARILLDEPLKREVADVRSTGRRESENWCAAPDRAVVTRTWMLQRPDWGGEQRPVHESVVTDLLVPIVTGPGCEEHVSAPPER